MKMKRHKLATLLILVLNVSLFGFNPSEHNAISQLEKTDTFQMAIIPIYLDTAYSFEERAADLVSRMKLEEKQAQLINTMPAIPRLGINAYQVWGEALHGLASFFKPIPATSFPNSGALGASWDPDLAQRETSAISDEARGSNYGIISGLTYWSPVVEPARDPRWGRNGESFSEDPFLVSKIASGFVKGFMGDDPRYYKSIPTAKHFTANNSEFNRHDGDSQMDERDLREYYLDPYRNLILRDRIPSIMTAYNSVNGIPITADTFLVDKIVRKNWGMDGYITSDCGGVNDLYAQHKYSKPWLRQQQQVLLPVWIATADRSMEKMR
jgi:beta-glucosidase